jgi:hypothetical protein
VRDEVRAAVMVCEESACIRAAARALGARYGSSMMSLMR